MDTSLTPRQKAIVAIGSFTANGDLEKLAAAMSAGLDAGLTVNEAKEIVVQMYAYAGFPRALNAASTLLAVMKERERKSIKDKTGKEPTLPIIKDEGEKYDQGMRVLMTLSGSTTPLPKGEADHFIPTMEIFLKEHLFADIFGRDNLDYLSRELATIGALGTLEGVNPMLTFHLGAAMNVGLSERQAREYAAVIAEKLGKERGDNATLVLETVLSRRVK